MTRRKVLALVMAGGTGGRMELLTQRRAKPALPYAGVYRLIDFPLSNCMHSGISDVWIVEQYQPHLLNEHLANGRPWDLDRTYGGLQLLPPHQGAAEGGWHQGNADAIYRNRRLIRGFDPDIVLVLSADGVYTLDYQAVIDHHCERSAAVTMATTRVPREQAGRFGVVQVAEDGRVTDFEYKPERPRSDLVTIEVFVYDARTLLDTIDELTGAGGDDGGEAGSALKDFGHELLPKLVADGRAYEYRFDGYWRDVGTIESYWQSHMDLLAAEPTLALDDPGWPILTRGVQLSPARIHASARIDNSLISPGCTIRGRVVRSVLGPGVVVEEGATVRDAILLGGCIVGPRSVVDCAILDEAVHLPEGARVGERGGAGEGEAPRGPTNKAIALVGQGAQVPSEGYIPAGGRAEPGDLELARPACGTEAMEK